MGKIYKITNKVNGKIYVGKTMQTLEERFSNHWRDAVWGNTNSLLHRAMVKYGRDNFSIELLEECNSDNINEREMYWIKTLESKWGYANKGYNMTDGGEGVLGYGHTEETKQLLREKNTGRKHTPEVIKRIGDAHRGKVVSKETREKLSKARMGKYTKEQNSFYGKKHTEETKRRLSEARKGKISSVAKPVMVMDLEGKDIKQFPSMKQCYEWLYENNYTTNKNYRSVITQIRDTINGKQTKAFGFTYRLVEKV